MCEEEGEWEVLNEAVVRDEVLEHDGRGPSDRRCSYASFVKVRGGRGLEEEVKAVS